MRQELAAAGGALAAPRPEGAYSIVERKDGTKQWAKDGMPLYYWVKDTKMGDISGDGVKAASGILQSRRRQMGPGMKPPGHETFEGQILALLPR